MDTSSNLFEASLKCPTKCWLRATGEPASGNDYADWVKSQTESYRATEIERLLSEILQDESAVAPVPANLITDKWRLAVDVPMRHNFGSSRGNEAQTASPDTSQSLLTSAATIETRLHAIERNPSAGRGRPAQFVPIHFIYRNKPTKDDRLLLAFDAFKRSAAKPALAKPSTVTSTPP